MFVVGRQVAGAGAQHGQGAVEVGIYRSGPACKRRREAVDCPASEAIGSAIAIGRSVWVTLAGQCAPGGAHAISELHILNCILRPPPSPLASAAAASSAATSAL